MMNSMMIIMIMMIQIIDPKSNDLGFGFGVADVVEAPDIADTVLSPPLVIYIAPLPES
jgi:hypothetical protein